MHNSIFRWLTGASLVLVGYAANAAVISDIAVKRYEKKFFDDHTESFGIYHDAVSSINERIPQSAAVYIPLTVSISNQDTTFRGATAELLRTDFQGRIQSLGRVGNIYSLLALDANNLLVQTDVALSRISLVSHEEVWKVGLPRTSGAVSSVNVGDDGFIYVQDNGNRRILKLNPNTAAIEKQIFPNQQDTSSFWSISRINANGQILMFAQDQYILIDDNAKILWQQNKLYPKSYGGLVVSLGSQTLLTQYISATDPNENLRRRFGLTLIEADGKQVWHVNETYQFLTHDQDQLYFQDYKDAQKVKLVAVAKNTGKAIWSVDLTQKRDVALTAMVVGGKVVLGGGDAVRVFDSKTGVSIATRTIQGRSGMKILAVQGNKIVASNYQAAGTTVGQFINFMSLDESQLEN